MSSKSGKRDLFQWMEYGYIVVADCEDPDWGFGLMHEFFEEFRDNKLICINRTNKRISFTSRDWLSSERRRKGAVQIWTLWSWYCYRWSIPAR